MTEKKFNVQTIIDNCGLYTPLCFKANGRVIKYDYDLELYCDILKKFAQDKSDYIGTKPDFCFLFYKYIYEKLDDKKYDAMYDKSSDKTLKKGREAINKKIDRYNKRLLNGEKQNKEAQSKVASDKTCFKFLKKVQEYFKEPILTQILDDKPYYYETKYIYSLISQLIEEMYSSENFNYIPNSRIFQKECYYNKLIMIENNIKQIFEPLPEKYILWMEIIAPFRQIICESSYPGIKKNDIWHKNCAELRFFDCTYEFINDYNLYCKAKDKLEFNVGLSRIEMEKEKRQYYSFLNNNKQIRQDEQKLFCEKMLSTLKKIILNEFGINV